MNRLDCDVLSHWIEWLEKRRWAELLQKMPNSHKQGPRLSEYYGERQSG